MATKAQITPPQKEELSAAAKKKDLIAEVHKQGLDLYFTLLGKRSEAVETHADVAKQSASAKVAYDGEIARQKARSTDAQKQVDAAEEALRAHIAKVQAELHIGLQYEPSSGGGGSTRL